MDLVLYCIVLNEMRMRMNEKQFQIGIKNYYCRDLFRITYCIPYQLSTIWN